MGVGEDDEVPVEIADPDLPMASVRVEVYVGDDLGGNVADPADRGVEIVDLEPDRNAVAERLLRVSNRTVVMTDLKPVQLQDHDAATNNCSYSVPP